MPNLMIDFAKGLGSTVAPASLTQLRDDAAQIFTTVIGGAKTGAEKYKEMRRQGSFKKAVDYLMNRGEEFSAGSTLDSSDDEFDAGTDFGASDVESSKTRVLDYEGMKGLAKGQVSAMYDIGGKQAEAAAMNSAEIITTINTRSSEILSSLTQINTNLSGISQKLDKLLTLYSGKSSEGSMWGSDDRSVLSSNGGITLGSASNFITKGIKGRIGEYSSSISMAVSAFRAMKAMGGMMGKGEALGMGVGMAMSLTVMQGGFFDNSKIGKIVTDAQSKVNDAVENAQNDLLTKLFSWDKFKNFFGDMTRRTANQDYGTSVVNKYDRDRAVFDNITRHTIVSIIPGYLRKITQALTGQEYFVDNKGLFTTSKEGGFKETFLNAVTDGMSSKTISKANSDKSGLSDSDLYTAQRILMSMYVGECLVEGINIVQGSIFESGGMPEANNRAIEALAGHNGKDKAYWSRAVGWVIAQLQLDKRARGNFVRTLNRQIPSTDSAIASYAKNATFTMDIGRMGRDLQDQVIKEFLHTAGGEQRTYRDLIRAGVIDKKDVPKDKLDQRASDEALKKAERERIRQSELIGNVGQSVTDISRQTTNYVASIFEILNRGINVYALDRNTPFKPFKPVVAKPIGASTSLKETGKISEETKSELNELPDAQQQQQQGGQQGGQQQQPGGAPAPGGRFDGIRSKIRGSLDNLRADAGAVKDAMIERGSVMLDRAIVKHDLKGDEISEQDKQIAQGVLAAMQAAVADGDTAEDLGALSQEVSNIQNPGLRARLQNIVSGTLSRAEGKPEAKSKIGKILLWGFGLVKKFVTPIISKAKSLISGLGKKIVGPLLTFVKNNLIAGGKKIVSGVKNIGQGIFGSEETGGLIRDIPGGIKKIGQSIAGKVNEMKEHRLDRTAPDRVAGILEEIRSRNAEPAEEAVDPKKLEKQLAKAEKARLKNEKKIEKLRKRMEIREEKGSLGERIANAVKNSTAGQIMGKIGDKIKNSSFGKGFASAFQKEMKPQTLADKSTKDISDAIKDTDGKIGGKETVFSRIIKGLGNIVSAITGGSNEGDNDSGDEGTTGTESGGGKKKGLIGRIKDKFSNSAGGQAAAAGKGGIGFDLGKIFGGMTKVLMGIGQQVVAIIAGMSGFKALMELGTQILKTSLKPLNKVFQKAYKALQPIVKTITKTLTEIVEYIVQICDSVIQIIQPILEAIGPIIEQLMGVLSPILDMITDLVNVLMVPLVAVMKSVVVPVLQTVANTLEIILGVVQVGMGLILTVLGGILTAVGMIGKLFGAGSLADTGKSMMETGTNMLKSGTSSITSGFSRMGNMLVNAVTAKSSVDQQQEEETSTTSTARTLDASKIPDALGGPMDGVTGSASQGRYGTYLNMGKRGCGPVALADAYSRRTGGTVSPTQLASAMSATGGYSASSGTSVGGYMRASSALGMNVRAGGVTSSSLQQATPFNPITVVGSGQQFSTRPGNNHYMNVIGTSNGVAYVSNPMSGQIERKNVSALVNSSVLGLYGSGDELDDTGFHFPDAVKEVFNKLKGIVGNIFSMFEMKDEDDTTEGALKAANAEQDAARLLSGLTNEERAEIEVSARAQFESDYPRNSGESDGDYDRRYEKQRWEYIAHAAAAKLKKAQEENPNAASFIAGDLQKTIDTWSEGMESADSSVQQNQALNTLTSASGATGTFVPNGDGFYSAKGAQLATAYSPSIKTTNITNHYSTESPIHEFFSQMTKGIAKNQPYSDNGNWFNRRKTPNTSGVGSTGDSGHSGIDFVFRGSGLHEPEIPATTAGTITNIWKNHSSMGNAVEWRDAGGDLHRYYHLEEAPYTYVGGSKQDLEKGDAIEGGAILGKVGNTGNSYGSHLHYTIRSNGSDVNPLTFFQWMEGASEYTDLGNTTANYYRDLGEKQAQEHEVYSSKDRKTAGGMSTTGNASVDAMLGIGSTYDSRKIDINERYGLNTTDSNTTTAYTTEEYVANQLDDSISIPEWPGYYAKYIDTSSGQFTLYNSAGKKVCLMIPQLGRTKTSVPTNISYTVNMEYYSKLHSGLRSAWAAYLNGGYEDGTVTNVGMVQYFAYYACNYTGERLPAGFKTYTKFNTTADYYSNLGKQQSSSSSQSTISYNGLRSGGGGSWAVDTPKVYSSASAEENNGTNVIRGSGDAASIIPMDIPPIDQSKLQSDNIMSQFNNAMNAVDRSVQSSSFISSLPQDTMSPVDRLDKILNNTYNVKSENIENMLTEMLKLMRERNQQRRNRRITPVPSRSSDDAQFPNNTIPRQVERLSIG